MTSDGACARRRSLLPFRRTQSIQSRGRGRADTSSLPMAWAARCGGLAASALQSARPHWVPKESSIRRVSSVTFQIEIRRPLRLGSAFQITCSVPHMLTFPYSRSHNPLFSYHISHLADFKTTNQILHRKAPECPNLGLYAYNNPICMYGMMWCGIHKGLKAANPNTHKTESHQTDKPTNL